MIGVVRNKRMLAALLGVALILGTFGSFGAAAQGRPYQRSHHSRTKGAIIGAAAGGIGGAVIGGGKGALIGAGAGAGTGYMVQRYRNRRHRHYFRRHRRDYRRR